MKQLIDKLAKEHRLAEGEFLKLLRMDEKNCDYLYAKAREVANRVFGNQIYIRGLIEISNYCKNDCYYCGIRKSNQNIDRYRLSKEEIINCCREGYALGFRTFVLQAGEDEYFNDQRMCEIIGAIKKQFPDCALTLSLGEKSLTTYQAYYACGADRYLLRHESINDVHYRKLHPEAMRIENRVNCLYHLKEIGFQVGSGMMIGSPYQKDIHLVEDLLFLDALQPHMIGIGPYLPHKDTPFAKMEKKDSKQTLILIAILRLMFPFALIPATTALGTMQADGRESGILAGANVVMPNLSPFHVRKKYALYDNKLYSNEESAQSLHSLKEKMRTIGYEIVNDRGDHKEKRKHNV